ncbi:MAG: hypothetical protein JXL97_11640 [Bacteroidales bacterium]|nr:hypothetical protein [Bacteroidales bacterium]
MKEEKIDDKIIGFIFKVVQDNRSLFDKIEISIIPVFIIGLILHYLGLAKFDFIVITSSSICAILYYLLIVDKPEYDEEYHKKGYLTKFWVMNFMYKMKFISLSTLFMILLLIFLINDNGGLMIWVIFWLILVLTISIITEIKHGGKPYKSIFYIRLIAGLILASSIYFLENFATL